MLIVAYSKWIEVFPTTTPSSNVIIKLLHLIFAQFGISEIVFQIMHIVSDNGSCFVSEDFQQFNDIKQITSAPYHPSTNGLAEKAVQIVKNCLKRPQPA